MESVERELYVEARPEVVWAAVTQPEGRGTRLRVVESGFERLEVAPEEQAKRAEESEHGWDGALAALTELAPTL